MQENNVETLNQIIGGERSRVKFPLGDREMFIEIDKGIKTS